MKSTNKVIYKIFLLLLFAFCACDQSERNSGTGTISYVPEDCTMRGQNEFVYKVMTDTYLWNDIVPAIDPEVYATPSDLLADARNESVDRWSHITSETDYHSYYEEGKYFGLGFSFQYDNRENLRTSFVYKHSAAGEAGLERGDILLEINEKTVEEINNQGLWESIMGPDEPGITVELKIRDENGEEKYLLMEKNDVYINTVLFHDIIEVDGKKTGYLVLKSFLETTKKELDAVFADFKNVGVDDLILDLRYNSGGRFSSAVYLASLIGGSNVEGKIFQKHIHNDQHRDWDRNYSFLKHEYAINLSRVIFIATGTTCSASESVINGLAPFIDVVIVGDTTCGKPVGMYGHDFCDKRIQAIEFQVANADGQGAYFDGIPVDVAAKDDVSKKFGDLEEEMLKAALDYIASQPD
ncbi:S41 family peptidase [Desulfobacterales bacterium HSG16]|nr:S41 family peptidase [Desulfobacterales bacterium HSG16]